MAARAWIGLGAVVIAGIAFVAMRSSDDARITSGRHAFALITEPSTLIALEHHGLALGAALGARGETGSELASSPTYRALVDTIDADLAELARRPEIGDGVADNHPCEARWLRDADARFELVGLVPRLDRAFAEPDTCGELRRVYRLTLTRPGRPTTRLPMTLSLLSVPRGGCQALARMLLALPRGGSARVRALADLFGGAPQRIEINLQNLHGPATPRDNEDHAEYLLRSFDVTPVRGLVARPLLATPREDLSPAEKDRLAAYLRAHFDEIDRGTLVLPAELLATRVVSVSPRGLARARNRVFRTLFGPDAEERFAGLPYETARVARSPRALLRRLDQGTCQGCHQSRAVAGFHLLGEERDARTFNALRVGISNHLAAELPWREATIEAIARGEAYDATRPFAERAGEGPGGYGTRCGLGDPGFAAYTCAPGLVCEDDRGDELGACLPGDGPHEGDACERATVRPGAGAAGDRLSPLPSEPCRVGGHVIVRDGCLGNGLGFPGGMCVDRCDAAGALLGETICADLPASGYEEACFRTGEPIERCLATRMNRLRVRACDEDHPCRDDYACARASGPRGACVPPYFVFQARVDGPRADR